MIETLTDEQERLMSEVVTEYENLALGGDDAYDIDEIRKGIDFIYTLAELESPTIVICNDPMEMAIDAELKKGETIDYLGCGYDAGWTAYYDFMSRIGIEYEDEIGFKNWMNFIKKSGVFATVLCEDVAFVCIRPVKINRDPQDELHCETGKAVEWRNGYGDYFLHGVSVDENLVMTPAEKLDPHMLLTEKNAEVRREIVRKIGMERIILKLGAKSIDKMGDYELLDFDLGDGRRRPYLKMLNPSIKTWHLEGVPPEIRTVPEALAWRNQTTEGPTILT